MDFKLVQQLRETMSNEDVHYNIWVEGPTFTSSQGGGHAFFDGDLYQMVKSGKDWDGSKVTLQNDNISMTTYFNPYDYTSKADFDAYWKKESKNGKMFEPNNEDIPWSTTLTQTGNKWYFINTGKLKDILEVNDATSEENKRKLLPSYKPSQSKPANTGKEVKITVNSQEELIKQVKLLAKQGYKWIDNSPIDDKSIKRILTLRSYDTYPLNLNYNLSLKWVAFGR